MKQRTTSPLTPAAAPPDLEALYQSWGLLDLLAEAVEDLPREWLRILDIARNLLDGRPLPGVEMPRELTALLTRETETYERRRVKTREARRQTVLSEEVDIRPIESFSEYPKIIPGQRMWQFIDPDLFYYRIYAHEILVREREYRATAEEDDDDEEEIITVKVRRVRPRQRVLVLRDTSSSMRDDNKGMFAKAVALAYLIKAQEEGAEVMDRSFANRVHERLRATDRAGFATIAKRILTEPFVGTTNIAAAFERSATEIRREELGINANARAQTEILLISDCENPEPLPPLPPGVVIHTLHLEGGREGRMLLSYAERLKEIQDVSTVFVRIDTSALQLPPALSDAWAVLEEARTLAEARDKLGYQDTPNHGQQREAAQRVQRNQQLLSVYQRLTSVDRQAGAFRAEVRRMYLGQKVRQWPGLREIVRAVVSAPPQLWQRLTPTRQPAGAVAVRSRPVHPAGVVFRPK